MISEGRPLLDNRFKLKDGTHFRYSVELPLIHISGILQLELDRATYERCGLVGKAIPSLGRKHIKTRYRKF